MITNSDLPDSIWFTNTHHNYIVSPDHLCVVHINSEKKVIRIIDAFNFIEITWPNDQFEKEDFSQLTKCLDQRVWVSIKSKKNDVFSVRLAALKALEPIPNGDFFKLGLHMKHIFYALYIDEPNLDQLVQRHVSFRANPPAPLTRTNPQPKILEIRFPPTTVWKTTRIAGNYIHPALSNPRRLQRILQHHNLRDQTPLHLV